MECHLQTKTKHFQERKVNVHGQTHTVYTVLCGILDMFVAQNQKGIASSHSSLAIICDTNVKYPRIGSLIRIHVCIYKWYHRTNWIWFISDINGTTNWKDHIFCCDVAYENTFLIIINIENCKFQLTNRCHDQSVLCQMIAADLNGRWFY